ncbi:MAG: DUF3604 domain-containing protein [Steroidobacteraceae bacterium]
MGIYARLKEGGDPRLDAWEVGQRWAELLRRRDPREAALRPGHGHDDDSKVLGKGFADTVQSKDPRFRVPAGVQESIWAEAARTADRFNEPGRFTALVAYEWTSMIGGDNLHRVVLYRDGADKAAQVLPFTAQDSTDPEDLARARGLREEDGWRGPRDLPQQQRQQRPHVLNPRGRAARCRLRDPAHALGSR